LTLAVAVLLPHSGVLKKGEFMEDASDHKENQTKNRPKMSVKFSKTSVDDDGQTWLGEEIKRLESRLAELIVENQDLKQMVENKHFDQV
jgi:hypothetical protein